MKTGHDTLGRRNRMRANPKGKRIRLSDRDRVWFAALHRHGPLSSSFLLEFTKGSGVSEKRAKERLCDLFHEPSTPHKGAYLKRPPQQFQTIDSRYNQLVYDLAPAGHSAVTETGVYSERSGSSGSPWWHAFMVASVTASIELATRQRDDLTFIPQAAILDRAETSLSTMVEYRDPASKRQVVKRLTPDAVFGLEYHTKAGSRFRFFALEADRATEPLTTKALNRKSIQRNYAQYQAYIEGGAYRQHLRLTSPLLVLHVTTSHERQVAMVKTLKGFDSANSYTLFQHWDAFAAPLAIPTPNAELLSGFWERSGHPSIAIDASR